MPLLILLHFTFKKKRIEINDKNQNSIKFSLPIVKAIRKFLFYLLS